jgi:aldose 1-epimerase
MARFTIKRSTFGAHETVILEDTGGGTKAVIARPGATLLRLHVPLGGELFDITDGCATPEELAQRSCGRAILMAPWSNRIDDGKYEFGGRTCDLGVTDTKNRTILHGFVSKGVWDVAAETGGEASASVTFVTRALRQGAFRGYPFDVDVSIAYTLKPSRLEVEVAGRNVGKTDAPFGCGWHPYFRTSAKKIDGLRLIIPCRQRIASDPRLLPLAGDAAYVPIEKSPEFDFRAGRPGDGNVLAKRFIDGAFAELEVDCGGWAHTTIEDAETRRRIVVFQEGGLMHVFTGDPLPVRPRQALALEPVEFMTNAFNRPECRAGITLKAGAERRFRFGVEAATF